MGLPLDNGDKALWWCDLRAKHKSNNFVIYMRDAEQFCPLPPLKVKLCKFGMPINLGIPLRSNYARRARDLCH